MENIKFHEIYNYYRDEYERIFKMIYPENHAERFTEENQTLNFYNAIRRVYKDTVSWFEYPWRIDGVTFAEKKSSSKRFDGVIYVPELDYMFVVEYIDFDYNYCLLVDYTYCFDYKVVGYYKN